MDGLVGEIGQNALLNVEEEIRRGKGPAPILLQHMVEKIVKVKKKNFKNATKVHAQSTVDGPVGEFGQNAQLNVEEERRQELLLNLMKKELEFVNRVSNDKAIKDEKRLLKAKLRGKKIYLFFR